jgi:hypothetical protein
MGQGEERGRIERAAAAEGKRCEANRCGAPASLLRISCPVKEMIHILYQYIQMVEWMGRAV